MRTLAHFCKQLKDVVESIWVQAKSGSTADDPSSSSGNYIGLGPALQEGCCLPIMLPSTTAELLPTAQEWVVTAVRCKPAVVGKDGPGGVRSYHSFWGGGGWRWGARKSPPSAAVHG
jgi:hypothetical protein